ncbi:MAG: hypothetical protein AVDCRST_MAG11-3915, partial [uncultured Gemmatimonadaceae bacterium]
ARRTGRDHRRAGGAHSDRPGRPTAAGYRRKPRAARCPRPGPAHVRRRCRARPPPRDPSRGRERRPGRLSVVLGHAA